MRDQHEQDGSNRCGGQRIKKASAENAQAHVNPSANEGADNAKNNVGDAAKAAAARNFSVQPSGDEADDDPAPESGGAVERNTLGLAQGAKKSDGHSASKKNLVRIWACDAQKSIRWAAVASCNEAYRGQGLDRGRRCPLLRGW